MKLRHIIKKEHGQAMVEFALVLPILLLLIGGIIDFGWIFYNNISANNACREAARYVGIHYRIDPINGDDSIAESKALLKVQENTLPSFTIETVTVDNELEIPSNLNSEEYITVNLAGKVIVLTPILQTIVGDEYEINVATTMRVEK